MKQKHFIDIHKGATFFYIIFLLLQFKESSFNNLPINIYIYLALHGSYGFLDIEKLHIS